MRASVRVAAAVLVVITVMLWAIPSSPVVAQAKKMRVGLVFDVGDAVTSPSTIWL